MPMMSSKAFQVGSYDDIDLMRTHGADRLEGGQWASRFPVLMSHGDSDGEWTPQEAVALGRELRTIEDELAALPATGFPEASWQSGVANAMGVVPGSLAECFIDVDGEPPLARVV